MRCRASGPFRFRIGTIGRIDSDDVRRLIQIVALNHPTVSRYHAR